MSFDVIVIGGGPAGMMAAGTAGSMGKKVLLIEKNNKLGKKLYITGKGRCNITNFTSKEEFIAHITKNPKFLYSSFNNFFNTDLMDFFADLGLKTKIERGGRVFPVSDKSSDVIKSLEKYLMNNDVTIRLNTKVKSIKTKDGEVEGVELEGGDVISSSSAVVTTGGLSYPLTGSTGDGYKFAKILGHEITDLKPSLVPLIVKEDYIKEIQGLSLKNVTIKASCDGKVLFEDTGEMLFTHYGLSGPLILSASFFISEKVFNKKKTYIIIDLKPGLTNDELNRRLLKDFDLNKNKYFKNSLDNLLPQKIIPIIINLSGIPGEKEVNQISREERKNLVALLKNMSFEIIGTRPISEAIVTSGGVNIKGINPKTMESKLVRGLFFAGEVLDVDAFTGGYNLQIAFSTGYTAGLKC
ncbi:MAG: NAD(P)/FAD-dependent oxidoreductase [Lutispora sp.]|nr:NAD(P)/FAD-dependent oxidoreductase [Lutispora sp.]